MTNEEIQTFAKEMRLNDEKQVDDLDLSPDVLVHWSDDHTMDLHSYLGKKPTLQQIEIARKTYLESIRG